MFEHGRYLDIAINEAKKAWLKNNVPVGAVFVVKISQDDVKRLQKINKSLKLISGIYITKGYNKVYDSSKTCFIINHAEIVAINKMVKKLGICNFNSINASIYTTLEPCVMCAGFIGLSKIKNVIFCLRDEKFGFLNNLNNQSNLPHLLSLNQYNFNYFYGFKTELIRPMISNFFVR
jgi:tRNA(adenine34) deaminase